MIPNYFVHRWSEYSQWRSLAMVEQDLVISRAITSLYQDSLIRDSLVFRGGTALNKLYLDPPSRYSEDIDFVQRRKEPIGQVVGRVKDLLQPWLDTGKWRVTERGTKIIFRYQDIEGSKAKLKVEINTTEHFHALPLVTMPFAVDSEWYSGECNLITYSLEELIATKLRALYQRRKGRDLFDLWHVLKHVELDLSLIIGIFYKYCANEGIKINARLFGENLEAKRANKDFRMDMNYLLPRGRRVGFRRGVRIYLRERDS